MVGIEELQANSLRTLGLLQGRGLFRFFYKKPCELRSQANVYDMKVPEGKCPPPAVRHVPMRVAPDNTAQVTPEPQLDTDTQQQPEAEKPDVEMKEAKTEVGATTRSEAQPTDPPPPVPA